MEENLIKKLLQALTSDSEVALVTVTNADNSSPRGKGSMMLVNRQGNLMEGTIGGGAVEEKAKADAAECIRRGISKSIHYILDQNREEHSLAMTCGGNIDVFIKVFNNRDKLLIVGAGHIGFRLSKLANILGYKITIIDDRKEFASKERFPEAQELIVGNIKECLEKWHIDEKTNIVIVSHGHKDDEIALETVIDSEARYIGMIGSSKKVRHCFNSLEQKGIAKENLLKIYTPIGLDIGGERPEEIALSIMAEIQSVKYNKKLNSLKTIKNIGEKE